MNVLRGFIFGVAISLAGSAVAAEGSCEISRVAAAAVWASDPPNEVSGELFGQDARDFLDQLGILEIPEGVGVTFVSIPDREDSLWVVVFVDDCFVGQFPITKEKVNILLKRTSA